jgi:hypothetical protein
MVRDEEIDEAILRIVRTHSRMHANMIPEIAKRLGVSDERVKRRLRSLEKDGKIKLEHVWFYPVDEEDGRTENSPETATLDQLIGERYVERYVSGSIPVQEVRSRTDGENGTSGVGFLLIYDMTPKVPLSIRRTIYNRLNSAMDAIRREGRRVERIQLSVIMTEKREDAEKLASCLPQDGANVRIFRVLEE